MDGSLGRSAQSSMDFAKNLSRNITIPITLWDERLSSEAAFKMTKDLNNNVTTQIRNLDKNSAAFILQGALDYLTN
jgi:putative Holliday junction resolvase